LCLLLAISLPFLVILCFYVKFTIHLNCNSVVSLHVAGKQKWVIFRIWGQNLVFLFVFEAWIMQHWFRLSSTGPLTLFC
jgi:hypothetical protein